MTSDGEFDWVEYAITRVRFQLNNIITKMGYTAFNKFVIKIGNSVSNRVAGNIWWNLQSDINFTQCEITLLHKKCAVITRWLFHHITTHNIDYCKEGVFEVCS
jgi:hypothetical protein